MNRTVEATTSMIGNTSTVIPATTRLVFRNGWLDETAHIPVKDLLEQAGSSLGKVSAKVQELVEAGATNWDLVKGGKYSPIGPDGLPMELHHIIGKEPGPIVELTQNLHRGQGNKGPLHKFLDGLKESFRNDPVKARQYDAFKKKYWLERFCGIITFNDPACEAF